MQPNLSYLDLVPDYAKYKPKINLEILTSRKADTMLLLTYFMFAACLAGSVLINIFITTPYEKSKTPTLVRPSWNVSAIYTTNFTFVNPPKVLTFEMYVKQTNFSSLLGWNYGSQSNICSPVSFTYESKSWACFNKDGCTKLPGQYNSWILQGSIPAQVVNTDMCSLKADKLLTVPIVSKTFHAQVIKCGTVLFLFLL